ncbi:6-phospho-beta-galactosidase [uncultured Vagococcus sp.]|uniref:6-phospho-beta-galactosidase n=1 Tax=uncultured Vagococcus sp. TaxID=189676 RepID=UPI0028D59809|nr:6-phospho-beta-galactosidase [uncultured Vagococcus sp.]
MNQFEEDFIFGAATAAYQAEGAVNLGGKGKTYWDDYLKNQGVFDPSVASDFYHQYPEDLSLCQQFGVNGIRLSIAWSRIFPDGTGEPNQNGIDFYHALIDECLKNKVEPFVTLHHFDTPEALYKKGDWLSNEMVDAYVDFSSFCFKEYSSKVNYWITINEPWSVVAGQYIIGHFPPNINYDIPKAIQSMHNMLVGHARVVKIFKETNYPGEIGIVHILESKYPIDELPSSAQAAKNEHLVANQFLLDGSLIGSYQEDTMDIINKVLEKNKGVLKTTPEEFEVLTLAAEQLDFLGINYYASHFLSAYDGESLIHHNGSGEKGSSIFALKGIGERVNNPAIPATDWDWPIYPQGLLDMLVYISKRYPHYNKLYITENGMGDKDILENGTVADDNRIEYVFLHLEAIQQAISQGINVKGYFIWSLMDVFSWTNGYNKRYGLFYVDFDTQKRYPKKSAHWFKTLSSSKQLISLDSFNSI